MLNSFEEQEFLFLAEKEAMQRAYTQQCDEHAQDLLRLKANTQDALTFDEDPCLKANVGTNISMNINPHPT